jgi:exodeoxyribonuclease V alpha subunit
MLLQVYSVSELGRDMDMGWAMSVHKAQGSEAAVVILVMAEQHMSQYRSQRTPFVTSEILYTGITRAKTLLFVVGTQRALDTAAATRAGARESIMADRLFHKAQASGRPIYPMQRYGQGLS